MTEPTRINISAITDEMPLADRRSGGHALNGKDSSASSESTSGVEDTYVLPASREQTRYWMLAQLDPASTASNMAIAFDIAGEMSDSVAEAAIAALTMRHEALRTLFRLESGVLSQVILSRPLYSFSVEDLSGLEEVARDEAANLAVSGHGQTLIGLHTGPVLHARLIHLDRLHHILALTMNHIVCDGWSNGILIRDFTIIYEALVAGREPVLPELPFQFADFALWQQEYLNSAEAEKAAEFWRSRVTSDLPALDLPTDFPRTAGRSFPGHIESALMPESVNQKLMDYCRTSGSTKHIVLLAAFETLCARYTGQTEFLLGSTIANRTQPGMENVVGRFANPQIIVAKVNGDPAFATLEQWVRERGTEAYNHQDLPFSRIIEDFQMTQAGATSQFLQVWFLYQKAFMQPQAGATMCVTPRRSVSGGVDFDLLVSIVERAEGPRIQMEYNTQLFTPERIRGLIDSFITLLEDALSDPSRPLSMLARSLFKADTPPELVLEKNEADKATPAASANMFDRLHQLAAELSDAVAVADATSTLSWAELEKQSSSIAAELEKRKVTELSIVAVHLAETASSVIALLGALKSGAQVLPLPWHSTASSVDKLLAQLPGALFLGPRKLAARSASESLFFDEFEQLAPVASFQPKNEPKLMFLTDAAAATTETRALSLVMTTLQTTAERCGLACGSRDGQESLLVFPAAGPMETTLDRLLLVASGAQLTFVRDLSIEPLDQQLARQQVTTILLSPAELGKIKKSGWQGDRRVSLVLRGGRLPAASAVQAEDARLPLRCKSVVYLLSDERVGGYVATQDLPYGRIRMGLVPTSGELSVRAPQGKVVPPGAFGQLHLDAVALDWMGRSGTDGRIEAADRADRFVQVRGHRICLGEIEDALNLCEPVTESFSTVTTIQGQPLLLGYLVASPSSSSPSNTTGVHTFHPTVHLAETLPSHMVPAEYIWLEKLPLALDGRIDRAALPALTSTPKSQSDTATAGLTITEERLSAIWKEVLGLRHVDIHTPFFELGGSSLLLVRLFARINKAFDISLPITAIFDAKTIASLALALGGETQISPLVQVQRQGSKPPLFMIHSYLLYKGLSTSLGTDQPFYGLRELDRDGHLSIEERVSSYVKEIRQVQPRGPYHLAGWCAAGPLTVEVARQLIAAGQDVHYVALFDSWLPGYLESIESNASQRRRPFEQVSSKLAYHRRKMNGLTPTKKLRYVRLAVTRVVREARYHLYLKNWERLRRLSERYQFALPQFMHNTSLDTFSALKDYRGSRLPIRLTLIRAIDAREVPGAAVSCGWEQVAEQGVDVVWAPGDHESMFVGANLAATSSILRSGLAMAGHPLPAVNSSLSSSADLKSASLRGAALHVDCPIL